MLHVLNKKGTGLPTQHLFQVLNTNIEIVNSEIEWQNHDILLHS